MSYCAENFFTCERPGKQRERFDGQSGPDLMVLVAGSVAAIGGKAGTRRYGPATHANWRVRIVQKMQRTENKLLLTNEEQRHHICHFFTRVSPALRLRGNNNCEIVHFHVCYQIPVLRCYC